MRIVTVGENDKDMRLDKFILKLCPKMPKSLLYKYIRKKRIKVNGKKADISYILNLGDEVSLYVSDGFFKKEDFKSADGKLDIIYEDENIIIIEKPKGLKSQKDKAGEVSLVDLLKSYLYNKGEYDPQKENTFSPAIANRLDQNTHGLVIGAKNAAALRFINEKIKNREIKKYYLCLVEGRPPKDEDTLAGYIIKDEKENKSRIVTKPQKGAKEVITKYKVLWTDKNHSLLEIELVTGRSHQIRAHLASINCPIYGDKKYGGRGEGYQSLYAYKLEFCFKDNSPFDYLNHKTFTMKLEPYKGII